MARLKHSQSLFWSVRLTLLDLVALLVCGILSSELRDGSTPFVNVTLADGLMVVTICVVCLAIVGGYETRRDMCTLRYSSEHALAMCAVILISFLVTYTFSAYNNSTKPGRSVLLISLVLFTPLSLTYRYWLSIRTRRDAAARFIYILGTPKLAAALELICKKASFQHPLRFVDLDSEKASSDGTRSLAPSLTNILKKETGQCEGVVVDLSQGQLDPALEELLLGINLHAVPVYPVESFIETYFHKVDLSHVTLSHALDGTFKANHHSAYGKLKNLTDALLGAFFFLLTLPLMVLVAVVMKVADSGPILFTQTRVGRFERPFTIYKFRTMNLGGPETEGLYTLKGDPRITRLGHFLRRTRLDELPQLWNVVRGDMSLIGPRAEWSKLVETYKVKIPFYNLRFMVRPGITGWAQVNYGYGADLQDTFEKLQYDLYYIKHYSPQMDASIVLKTLFTILSASGR